MAERVVWTAIRVEELIAEIEDELIQHIQRVTGNIHDNIHDNRTDGH